MAARTPRRNFASPFVVTLAAVPACWTSSSPQQAPPTTTAQADPAPAPQPTTPPAEPAPQQQSRPPMNPPRPKPVVPAEPPGTQWTIFKQGDACSAAIKVECPQGATCNPPPPKPYACPDGITVERPVVIIAEEDGCYIKHEPVHCPPRVMCNPPPPHKVACPK
jgi:hypothetical protein